MVREEKVGKNCKTILHEVADPCLHDEDPDPDFTFFFMWIWIPDLDQDPTFHLDADPDPTFPFDSDPDPRLSDASESATTILQIHGFF